jgi:hypothetical protein
VCRPSFTDQIHFITLYSLYSSALRRSAALVPVQTSSDSFCASRHCLSHSASYQRVTVPFRPAVFEGSHPHPVTWWQCEIRIPGQQILQRILSSFLYNKLHFSWNYDVQDWLRDEDYKLTLTYWKTVSFFLLKRPLTNKVGTTNGTNPHPIKNVKRRR